jgi:hypothetical protein
MTGPPCRPRSALGDTHVGKRGRIDSRTLRRLAVRRPFPVFRHPRQDFAGAALGPQGFDAIPRSVRGTARFLQCFHHHGMRVVELPVPYLIPAAGQLAFMHLQDHVKSRFEYRRSGNK